jgi:hypothetical protein
MDDLGAHILKVAEHFWGTEHFRVGKEYRWGTHGSRRVNVEKGLWSDYELEERGGVVDLIKRELPGAEVNGAVAQFIDEFLGLERDQGETPALPWRDVAVYTYRLEDGTPHLVVTRKERGDEKRFHQALPDGRKPSDAADYAPVPYRLDRIAKANKTTPIFIVEGEKCVLAAEEWGLLATTNPGGANNWNDALTPYLSGRRVVIVPDNDEPGDKHARLVMSKLHGVAAEIRRVDLPGLGHKGDLADWKETHERDELIALCKAAEPIGKKPTPLKTVALADLMQRRPSGWLIDGLVPEASMTAIYGQPGSYKTFLALDMLLCLAHGVDYHGTELEQRLVVYIAGEGVGGLRRRIGAWHEHHGLNVANARFILIEEPVPLRETGAIEALIETIEMLAHGETPAAVVYDTLARCMSGDENSADDMGDAIRAIDSVRAHFQGSAALVIHHAGKNSDRGLRGSSALLGALDAALEAKKHDEHLEVVTQKQKDHEPSEATWFSMKSVDFQVHWYDELDASLVPQLLQERPQVRAELSPAERKCLEALYDAIIDKGYKPHDLDWPTVTLDQWRDTAKGMSISDGGAEAQRKAFQRAAEKLEKRGYIAAKNGRVWAVKRRENADFDVAAQ